MEKSKIKVNWAVNPGKNSTKLNNLSHQFYNIPENCVKQNKIVGNDFEI